MGARKKAEPFDGKWAVLTVHPWLPALSDQIARARAWGVVESELGGADVSAVFVDDVRRAGRTTNWPSKLIERSAFLENLDHIAEPGQSVFFATPLCVGFSAKVAQWTVEAIFAAGLRVYVHSVRDNGAALYLPGDDMADFYDQVAKAANAAHQSDKRARASKSKV